MWPPCLCMRVGVRSILTERNRMTKDAWMSDRQGEHKCISAFSKEAPRELLLCSVEERKRSKWKSISWLTEISVIYNSSHWLLVCIFAALQFNREAHCILSPVESFSPQRSKTEHDAHHSCSMQYQKHLNTRLESLVVTTTLILICSQQSKSSQFAGL